MSILPACGREVGDLFSRPVESRSLDLYKAATPSQLKCFADIIFFPGDRAMRRTCLFLALIVLSCAPALPAQTDSGGMKASSATAARDGQHDFDFEDGTWK